MNVDEIFVSLETLMVIPEVLSEIFVKSMTVFLEFRKKTLFVYSTIRIWDITKNTGEY